MKHEEKQRERQELALLDLLIERLAERERGPRADRENLDALNACVLAYNKLQERSQKRNEECR